MCPVLPTKSIPDTARKLRSISVSKAVSPLPCSLYQMCIRDSSQTMLDLYSIYKTQGTLENLNIFLVGDLKYGRTVHSLLMAMRHFNPTFHFRCV